MSNFLDKIKDGFIKNSNFEKTIKYFFAGLLFVFLLASIIVAFFGFNNSYDFEGGYLVNISFGTEITNEQKAEFTQSLSNTLKGNNITEFNIYSVGEEHQNGFSIKFRKANLTDEKKESLVESIENVLNPNEEFLGLNVSDIVAFDSSITLDEILLNTAGIITILLILLAYVAIRYNWSTVLAMLITFVHNIVLIVSMLALFRVEISKFIFMALIVSIMLSFIRTIQKLVKIKEGFEKEQFEKQTNHQIYSTILNKSFYSEIIIAVVIALLGIAVVAVGLPLAVEIGLSLVLIALVTTYSELVIMPTMWQLLYNRANDLRLKRTLENKKKKATQAEKENEKIVV